MNIDVPGHGVVFFPDEMSEDEIVQAIQKSMVKPRPPSRVIGGGYGFTDQTLNKATFGMSDRARAGFDTLRGKMFGEERSYKDRYGDIIAEKQQYEKESPWLSGTAGAVGAMTNPFAIKGGKWLGEKGLTLGQQMKRGTVLGGGLGTGQSAGEAPTTDPVEMLGSGINAAPLSLALGAAFPPVFMGLQKAWTGGVNMLSFMTTGKDQKTMAMRKIVEALKQDHPNMSLNDIAKRIQELGPEGALMDAGPNARGLLFAVFAKPGEMKKKIQDFLVKRQEGYRDADEVLQGGQIGRIDEGLTKIHPEQYQGKANEEQVKKLYAQAYRDNPSIQSSDLDLILKTPAGKDALREAVRRMRNRQSNVGVSDPELTALHNKVMGTTSGGGGVAKGLKLETWDQVKRAMDRLIGQLKNDPKKASEYADMIWLKNKMVRQLDDLSKGNSYKLARGKASVDFEIEEAAELGLKFMHQNMRTGSIKKAMDSMSPEALHEFRVSVVNAIREKLGGLVIRADATKKIFEIHGLEKKIALAFGSKERFKSYIKMLKAEQQMNKSYGVMGGSQTAERETVKSAAEIDPSRIAQGFIDFGRGNYIRGTGNIALGVKDKFFNQEGVTREMGKLLMRQDVSPLQETFRKSSYNELLSRRLRSALTAGSTGQGYKGY